MDTTTHLQLVFQYYCRFGRTGGHYDDSVDTLDSFQFAKFTRECPGLLDEVISPTEIDLVFIKVAAKHKRRINFSQFLDALSAISTVKYFAVVNEPAAAFSLLLTNQVFQSAPALGISSAVQQGLLELHGASGNGVRLSSTAAGGNSGVPLGAGPVSPRGRSRSPRRNQAPPYGAAASSPRRGGSPRASERASGDGGVSPRSPSGIAATMLRGAGLFDGPVPVAEASSASAAAAAAAQPLFRNVSAFSATAPPGGGTQQQLHGRPPHATRDLLSTTMLSGGSGSVAAPPANDSSSPVLSFVTPPTDVYELVLRKAFETQLLQQQAQGGRAAGPSMVSSGGDGAHFHQQQQQHGFEGGAVGLSSTPGPSSPNRSEAGGSRRTGPIPGGVSTVSGRRGVSRGSGLPSIAALAPSLPSAHSPRPASARAFLERGAGNMGRYGEPDFVPTVAGSANAPGSVYARLADPSSFTGVYRRAWESDGRINHFAETGLSNIPSRFRGNTNTGTDETIRDIRHLLRPNLNVGRYFK